jgi:hypothetical protein
VYKDLTPAGTIKILAALKRGEKPKVVLNQAVSTVNRPVVLQHSLPYLSAQIFVYTVIFKHI